MAIEDVFYDKLDVELKELLYIEFWADKALDIDSEAELLKKYERLLDALLCIPYVALLPLARMYSKVKKHMRKVREKKEQFCVKKLVLQQKQLSKDRQYE